MPKTTSTSTSLTLGALIGLLCLLGCPRGPQLPTQPGVGGLVVYDYSGVTVMHQQSDRGFVHLRLHFGWQRPEENSYAAQNLAVEAAFTCGAGDYSPRAFASKVQATGATIAFQQTADGPVVLVECMEDRLKATWELIDLCLTDPLFEKDSYARLRAARVAAQKALEADRVQQSLQAAMQAAWPMTEQAAVASTASNLADVALTTAQATYRDLMRQRCNLRLISVGPIEAERISDLLLETVDALPSGECADATAGQVAPQMGHTRLVQQSAGAQAISGIFSAPSPSQAATVQMRLVMAMVEQRLHSKLVVRDHIATRLEARYIPTFPGYNLLTMSGTNAFQCAEFALSELRKLKANGFGEGEVKAAKNALRSQLGLGYEAAASLSARLDAAAGAHLINLAGNEIPLLDACTTKSCNALLNTYLTGISWGLVGDTTGIDRKSLHRL